MFLTSSWSSAFFAFFGFLLIYPFFFNFLLCSLFLFPVANFMQKFANTPPTTTAKIGSHFTEDDQYGHHRPHPWTMKYSLSGESVTNKCSFIKFLPSITGTLAHPNPLASIPNLWTIDNTGHLFRIPIEVRSTFTGILLYAVVLQICVIDVRTVNVTLTFIIVPNKIFLAGAGKRRRETFIADILDLSAITTTLTILIHPKIVKSANTAHNFIGFRIIDISNRICYFIAVDLT